MRDGVELGLCLERTFRKNASNNGAEAEESLEFLSGVDFEMANYTVCFRPFLGGEQSVKVEHRGTLLDTIKKTEVEFKEINSTSNIQAYCSAEIRLGENTYDVSKECYEGFLTEEPINFL